MNFSEYQQAAIQTAQVDPTGNQGVIAPMLGLASETGQILNVYKKLLRDNLAPPDNSEFLKVELGDLLWYLAAVATGLKLDLDEIAQSNLNRTRDRYLPRGSSDAVKEILALDEEYPAQERFPRMLAIEFTEKARENAPATASLRLVDAKPNAFPNGPIMINGKQVGFQVGASFGADLTDNSRRVDDYRYHDAIHLAFMAVLGWSPTVRSLLCLKRRSNALVDEAEDGARAIYAEEGISAILSRLAEHRNGFETEASVDGDAIVVVKSATVGLEVAQLPVWLWRRAVSQGFLAMKKLAANQGGFLIADLDQRRLTFSGAQP